MKYIFLSWLQHATGEMQNIREEPDDMCQFLSAKCGSEMRQVSGKVPTTGGVDMKQAHRGVQSDNLDGWRLYWVGSAGQGMARVKSGSQ